MKDDDEILIENMRCYAERYDEKEYVGKLDLDKVLRSPQIANQQGDENPEIYKEFFKFASSLAKEFPDWHVLGYMMTTQGYTIDAAGNIEHMYSRKIEDHPIVKAAKKAPKEFKEFSVSSLASAREYSKYHLNALINNKEALNLKNEDIADIMHDALVKRDPSDKNDLARAAFYKLMASDNKGLLKDFISKYPNDFGEISQITAKQGYEVLLALGDGGKSPVNPDVQEWIDKNPETYEKIAQTAIIDHCSKYQDSKQQGQFDALTKMINRSFMAKNPEFTARLKQKMNNQSAQTRSQGRY